MMLHFGRDEDHTARGHFAVFFVNFEAGSSADDIIDLIFMVRPLQVRGTSGQDVNSGAHRWHAKEFAVQLAAPRPLLIDLGDAGEESFHAKIPPKIRSVN